MPRMVITVTIVLVACYALGAFGQDSYEETPYGDYCKACSYGVCQELLSSQRSLEAIESYYREKNAEIGSLEERGRFIEVEITREGRQVDRIIFDRKTGRMRSIY